MSDISKVPNVRIDGLDTKLATKQDKLVAGPNIIIDENNKISALGGGGAPSLNWYTGNRGTTITVAQTSADDVVMIYKNGVLLQPTEDYTLSGSTLTLVTPLVESDKIILSASSSGSTEVAGPICCANSGNKISVNYVSPLNGFPQLFSISGSTLSFLVGGTYPNLVCTPANGQPSFELSSINSWSGIEGGDVKAVICVTSDGTIEPFYISEGRPSQYISQVPPTGISLWLDISASPYRFYRKVSGSWVEYNGVPLGYVIGSGGTIQYAWAFPYNTGSDPSKMIMNYENRDNAGIDDSSRLVWFRLYGDGWCEQGGNIRCTHSNTFQYSEVIQQQPLKYWDGGYMATATLQNLWNPSTYIYPYAQIVSNSNETALSPKTSTTPFDTQYAHFAVYPNLSEGQYLRVHWKTEGYIY